MLAKRNRSHRDTPGLDHGIRHRAVFLGYHAEARAEMSSKVVRKASPEEKVGVMERRIIEDSLRRNKNHRQATAKELGISRVTLYNKMKKFGILSSNVSV